MLIGGRLVSLRDWTAADVSPLRSWLDPGRPWHRTNGPYFAPMTDADADAVTAMIAATAAAAPAELDSPRASLAIVESAADRLVGRVNWYWECRETDWRRMGVVIYDDSCWGRGYGTEALRLWTGYLFASTDALRLDYATYSGNPAMIAAGRRLGFVEEGRFRRARRWAGGVHDSVVMGVLREEWPPSAG